MSVLMARSKLHRQGNARLFTLEASWIGIILKIMFLYKRQKLLLSLLDAAGGELDAVEFQKLLFME